MCVYPYNLLYGLLGHANSVGVIKMGNIAPRAGIGTTSLAFRPSVLTIRPPRLPVVGTILSSWPEGSVQPTKFILLLVTSKVILGLGNVGRGIALKPN